MLYSKSQFDFRKGKGARGVIGLMKFITIEFLTLRKIYVVLHRPENPFECINWTNG